MVNGLIEMVNRGEPNFALWLTVVNLAVPKTFSKLNFTMGMYTYGLKIIYIILCRAIIRAARLMYFYS